MQPLTKKYVFECALKGERVLITNKEFLDNELLWSTGIISRMNEDEICYVQHDMMILIEPNERHDTWRHHQMDAGTPLANMDRW